MEEAELLQAHVCDEIRGQLCDVRMNISMCLLLKPEDMTWMQYIQQGRTFFILLIRGRGITYTDEKETATRAIKARTERMVKEGFFSEFSSSDFGK